jgi:lipopolysaccharide assembly outer membrane protein LptD (OstA)
LICFAVIFTNLTYAIIPDSTNSEPGLSVSKDTSIIFSPLQDTLLFNDTIIGDTIVTTSISGDTVVKENVRKAKLDDKLERFAVDSIVQDIIRRKIFLYGDAEVVYQDITLKAAYIEVDLSTNTVFASGLEDSTGTVKGMPEFTQGDQTFKSETMTYNFDTQNGIITSVVTEDGNGFLHGQKVKKLEDNTVNILRGTYTTCNLEKNPHFGFRFKKSRVIPDSKIVTGPAYMEIEQMPTPVGLPFGFFPNKAGQTSGIVIPTFGEYTNRGFYLEDGGYYWAINEYMDLQVLGDIYSRGGWGIKPRYRYKKRYRYSGNLDLGYAVNIIGTKDAPDYQKSTDFRIRWSHKQDPKARPNSNFSADVNILSGNYDKYNVTSTQDFLSNEFQSSIAYQKNWGSNFFMTLNASHRQNTQTHVIDVTLPELTFTVNRFYPLRSKKSGKKRFYEDLSVSYSFNAKNQVSTIDSIFFDEVTWTDNMQWGAVHKVPISLPLKVLKYFTLSNSVNITDRMYGRTISRYYESDTTIVGGDTIVIFQVH